MGWGMTEPDAGVDPETISPLRDHGVYLFRGNPYVAVPLSTPEMRWRSTGLIYWPDQKHGPFDIIYLRHVDHILLSVKDFRPIGTIDDLEDTGRTETGEEEIGCQP